MILNRLTLFQLMLTVAAAFQPHRIAYTTTTHTPAISRRIITHDTAAAAAYNNGPRGVETALAARAGNLPCRPIGIGSATPHTVITNLDLEKVVETSDEWIRTRTGISERRVLLQGESIRDLQIRAAQNALDMAGVKASDIDLVICATSSPEDMFGDAPSVASALGCTKDTVAFDLTAACSGFLFATVTASKFLSSPSSLSKMALVVGADALSRFVDWDDRNSCILFGDGAGAMVIEGSDLSGIMGYAAHSNGEGYEELKCS